MSKVELSQRSLRENTHSPLSPIKIKSGTLKYSTRIQDLSQPKLRHVLDENIVGPGSYTPKDYFLSTKSKSPTIAIGRSERFIKSKLTKLKYDIRHIDNEKDLSCINYNLSDAIAPPKYTFNRTGHKLKLVENPSFPGVGRYTPNAEMSLRSISFSKASKNFDWKKAKYGWLL
ncbi:hypothetical protein SteCoe_16714 [Stentor coeruleus]|uniref:Uncharacterized protein n=1 Tax=Stentor coeruleus TaxID=5963 RepID=A0A1R2C0N1_9CILI|nr:hypothetical protein SteCoe_16714 [Stentor coeruleus]